MSDLVERLQRMARMNERAVMLKLDEPEPEHAEAAAEIQRLRSDLAAARIRQFLFACGVAGLIAGGIAIWIIASGGTFGYRCGKIFPDDQAAWEQCVERLAHGR